MILSVPAWRKGYLKVSGPVIDAALRRGHIVNLEWQEEAKPGERVNRADLLRRWPTVQQNAYLYPDAVIGPNLHTHDASRWQGARLISLDHAWEQANAPIRPEMLQCYASAFQREMARGFGPIVGSTTMDAFGQIDPYKVRCKYFLGRGGPTAAPILLLFTPKFLATPWRRWVYRYVHFRNLMQQLKQWCDEHHWLLVVKTREKHGHPRFMFRYTNSVHWDTDLWPHTSAQLTAAASLVLHYQSGACLEAAMANVPQYSIHLPQPHLQEFPSTKEVYSENNLTIGRWPRVIRKFTSVGRLEPFAVDPQERERYLSRYLGPSADFKSSERVLDLVEADAK